MCCNVRGNNISWMECKNLEAIRDALESAIEHKKTLKDQQEVPIMLASNVLSLFEELSSLSSAANAKLKEATDEINRMENRLSRLQYASTDDEEGIYETQLLIAEAESLLQLNHERKDTSSEERCVKFEALLEQLNSTLNTEYRDAQKKLVPSPVKGKIGPRIFLEKVAISDEPPLTGEELIQKIKKSGRFFKWMKSRKSQYELRNLCCPR
eukprot:TRINITY_DN10164_c0_g1_i4.p1 TRINITY_DN10164_c0_g1~~TRINITY_DN10164_c0_g1_i4.p1  ORF type:complete len:211 (+),score=56.94 TRINITY_DN10164_c0_g1_i4:98-730(+)